MIINIIFIFHEGNKYYPQFLSEECLHKLWRLEYGRIDVSEGIHITKTNVPHECIIPPGTFLR